MHWVLRLLGERNSLCHIQALLWLLVKQSIAKAMGWDRAEHFACWEQGG